MIIDLFSYNGEDDILEIRLNILDKAVDQFMICEGDETTAGGPKPRFFEKSKERCAKWLPKIKYFVMAPFTDPALSLLADTSPGVPKDMHWWKREFIQKESMRYALTHLHDDDRVFVGDVDEIWNMSTDIGDLVYKPKQLPYLYYLNNRTNEDWLGWTGTVCTKYKNIKNACINHLRTDSMTEYVVIENGGWHFNAVGGKQFKKRCI